MSMNKTKLIEKIQARIPDAKIVIDKLRGNHYAARIISSQFIGKTRLEQHKMVYDAVGSAMGEELHALALQTLTPDENNTNK